MHSWNLREKTCYYFITHTKQALYYRLENEISLAICLKPYCIQIIKEFSRIYSQNNEFERNFYKIV